MSQIDRVYWLLALQFAGLLGLTVGLVVYFYQEGERREREQMVIETTASPDASVGEWAPVERMEDLVGSWASTPDGKVVLSIAAEASPELGPTAGPWRMLVAWEGHPRVVCAVYGRLQAVEDLEAPWRLSHCQGFGEDRNAILPTFMGFYNVPEWPLVHAVAGGFFEVDLERVE